MPSADFCIGFKLPHGYLSLVKDTLQTSLGNFNHFLCTTAGSTTAPLDDYGLRNHLLARPSTIALYPIPVRQLADLLSASFRPNLTATPLRFATFHRHQVM